MVNEHKASLVSTSGLSTPKMIYKLNSNFFILSVYSNLQFSFQCLLWTQNVPFILLMLGLFLGISSLSLTGPVYVKGKRGTVRLRHSWSICLCQKHFQLHITKYHCQFSSLVTDLSLTFCSCGWEDHTDNRASWAGDPILWLSRFSRVEMHSGSKLKQGMTCFY